MSIAFKIGGCALVIGAFGLAVSAINMTANYGSAVPAPEVYVKGSVSGGPTDPESDPKAVIKMRNNGGNPMTLQEIIIKAYGYQVKSFREALGNIDENSSFVISTESLSFIQEGHKGRNIKGSSKGISLLVVRPRTTELGKTQQWHEDFRQRLKDRDISVEVKYKYFHVPFYGPAKEGSKVSKLV